jgi:hypothetical protein
MRDLGFVVIGREQTLRRRVQKMMDADEEEEDAKQTGKGKGKQDSGGPVVGARSGGDPGEPSLTSFLHARPMVLATYL